MNNRGKGSRSIAPNTDITYCTCNDCTKKCWRNVENYRFDLDEEYSYMEICSYELERREYGDSEK